MAYKLEALKDEIKRIDANIKRLEDEIEVQQKYKREIRAHIAVVQDE